MLTLLSAFSRGLKYLFRYQRAFACVLFLAATCWSSIGYAIPPNTPITNTARVDYSVDGVSFNALGSDTVVTDANAGNSPPFDLQLSPATVAENAPGAVVGTLVVDDLDPSDSHTYVLSDPRFVVVGTEIQLAPGVSLDFEVTQNIDLTVTVTDSAGGQYVEVFNIAVTDVNEAPVDIALTSQTVVAGLAGAPVGTLSVVDPDAGDGHTYVVDDPRFEVVGDLLKLVDGESLPLGTVVPLTITVTDAGGLAYVEVFDVSAVPPGGGSGTNSNVSVFQLAPGAPGAQTLDVGIAQCDAGAGLVDLPAPSSIFGGAVTVPGTDQFLPTNIIKSGDVLYIQVIDPDANLAAGNIDRLLVTISTESLDSETVSIAETAPNSGIFFGYLQTSRSASVANNCVIEVDASQQLTVTYNDATDPLDTATLNVLVDPFGLVFDSATGNPINGATVTIIDASTNLPATVFADDGISAFPATLLSGSTADNLAPGTYRFPFVGSGDYLLQVIPPNRFTFPSVVTDPSLQLLPGGPFALGPGSRGQIFTVPVGPAVQIDIPLDLQPIVPTASTLEVFALRPGSATANPESVQPAQCFDGSAFIPAGAPNTLTQGVVPVPATLGLSPSDRFARGDAVFIKLIDADQDLDPFAPDFVEVEVSVPGQVDVERVRLTETNDSTGIFTGYVQTGISTTGIANNCQLEAAPSSDILLSYVDASDGTDTSVQSALFDPGFTTFSSADGGLVSGAVVTLVDATTGLPAIGAVFSTDGITSFPATVTVGGSAADGSGQTFNFATGTFYFPVISPGNYRFEVSAPVSFEFPSQIDDDTLNSLGNGPFTLTPGSRGVDFTVVAGVPPAFDLPLDPINAEVFVTKQASKSVAAIGDFVQYQIQISNGDSAGTISNVALVDTLPLGFRYAADSLQIAGAAGATPVIGANGRDMRVALPDLAPADSVEVRYVVEITTGAKLGSARNVATVTGTGVGSANIAFADVEVKEDLLQSKAILVGHVFAEGCDAETATGMSDVRVWLEDGTFVVTDQEGKYHIEGIEPGTHVVQLDKATVPDSHEVVSCEQNTRFAGSNYSQFIDVQGGTLWRADFYLARKPDQVSDIVARLDAEAADGKVHYTYHLKGGGVALANLRATLMLDDQLAYLGGSAKLNGEPVGDPTGITMGAPTFKLPDTNAAFEYVVEFDAFVKDPRGLLETKAIAMFATTAGQHRTEVNVNELSLNWPSSVVVIAESIGPQSARNRNALRQARARNAERLAQDERAPSVEAPKAKEPSFAIQSEVHEPSRGSNRTRSNVTNTQVSIATKALSNEPYQLPKLDRGEAPPFDLSWLAANKDNHGIAWPPERFNPALPAVEVAVVHPQGQKPVLLVDGELVNPVTFEGTTTHHQHGVSFTRWDNVTVSERDSIIEARILDQQGATVSTYTRPVHFSGAPARAELVDAESYLIADGLYPPLVAVKLFDRAGFPLRPGTTGEFSVLPPYLPLDKAKHLENVENKTSNQRYRVLRDGIAYIQLEPTTVTGEVDLRFEFDSVRSDNIRARLIPGVRDWILVGLLEGTYANRDLSGNLQALDEQNLDDEKLTDGRAAFFAKGMVSGEWLLTVAYDTDKKFERRLREQIDPNQFYTLYGDGTEQLYDAESQRKLYLKLERSRFTGLFGDFDTDFERSELARYDRRMNGLKLGYFGEHVEVNAFASETDQAFIRDEIPGDGTSGVYRLSNDRVVVNSEAVRILTRDRFATENVLETVTLSRFIDYTIDYDLGTLIFKQPVFSQDGGFNPIFIEVEYEVANEGASEEVVAGARIAYRLDKQDSEVALTYVNDGTEGQSGDLLAADLTWQLNPAQKLTVELAQTDTDLEGRGDAYLVELERATEKVAGRVYYREQDLAFGLGNQSILEAGTRKYGVEGEYRLKEDLVIRGQAFQQELLGQGAERLVVNALGEWRIRDTKITTGLQSVQEQNADGDELDATQILLGAAHSFLRNKLVLRGDAEIDVSSGDGNTDYPSRGVIGAEYEVLQDVSLIAEQELTWGDDRDTQDTRFGVRARPWTGADVSSIVTRESGENGDRLFATTGLLQQWRLNEHWLYNVGFDRVQTLTESGVGANEPDERLFNPRVPPASGSFDGDFTAFFTGFGYRDDVWDVSTRLELHAGDQSDKWNLLLGANHQLAEGKVVAASLSVLNEETDDGAIQDNADLRVGLAWRPFASNWSFLNRTDLIFETRENGLFDTRTRKWVNNFNANFKPVGDHQLALQLAMKYVVETIDNEEFDGTTLLYGAEYRYDLSPKWDVGIRGAALQSFSSDVVKYSYGASVGHNLMQNMWLSVGYNVQGFDDEDFIAAEYTAQGPYLKIRLKLDQDLARRFLEYAGLSRKSVTRGYANGR